MKQQIDSQISIFKAPIDSFLVDNFSAGGLCPEKARKSLEDKYSNLLEVTDQFNRQTVSYQMSKKDLLHSWLAYREAFSAGLVNTLLDEIGAEPGDWIIDPFVGSGTTALVCQMRGINSIGYDIMPISTVSIKAKAAVLEYNLEEIKALVKEIASLNVPNTYNRRTPYITITQDAYSEENEKFLQYVTEWRDMSDYSEQAKNLLTLCIINSLERCSYTLKAGQYLRWDCRSKKVINANKRRAEKGQKLLPKKYVRDIVLNSKDTILGELYHVLRDIEVIQSQFHDTIRGKIEFTPNSALYELTKLQNNFLTGVITSPPYCNRYDYTRTYALELAYLGLSDPEIKAMRQRLLSCTVESRSKIDSLRSFYKSIGQSDRFDHIYNTIKRNDALNEIIFALETRKKNGDLNNIGIIRMVDGYFTELAFIYAELYRVCKPGATAAFVNDNVRYGGEIIPVDFLSSSLAEQFGFKVKKIYSLRQQKGNSSQQMAKFGKIALRKSITIWVKES